MSDVLAERRIPPPVRRSWRAKPGDGSLEAGRGGGDDPLPRCSWELPPLTHGLRRFDACFLDRRRHVRTKPWTSAISEM
jgi:hypothetical protein